MSMIGKTLIQYEISSQIGRGGMGEVYQAKDTKLGRDVAIKILPEEFARDADRVVRFQREAKLLASLNHPNIAVIYGLEESDGTNFLVMELIEGNTLADRIKKGPIPVEEALKLALQIVEALEAAHEKGVIHRDLKPANIKITPEGKIKVLDFGLAKAFAEDEGEEKPLESPTLSDAATRQGIILGTAAYMSPEQARGKPVDKRADIWAFGVILFEMLTGRALFEGEDVTSTLARVLERDPDFSTLPPNLHPRIRFLLERCLEKDPGNRYNSIIETRIEIQKVLSDPGGVFVHPIAGFEPQKRTRTTLTWVAVSVILTALIVGAIIWILRTPEPKQVISLSHEVPEDQRSNMRLSPALAVSPDGSQIVYVSTGLYSRSIGEMDARLITGTDNDEIVSPFFSPDGKWIAYFSFTDTQLKKIPVAGGSPIPLCDLINPFNTGDWVGNKIIFSGPRTPGIMEIPDNGGTAKLLFEKKEDAGEYRSPQMLPDGKSILFTTSGLTSTIMVKSLETGEVKEIIPGRNARYLSSGYLVYLNRFNRNSPLSGNLFAVPFDIARLERTGEPFLMVENIFGDSLAISDSGTLAYVSFESFEQVAQIMESEANSPIITLVWVDREGKEEEFTAPPLNYRYPKISPDGKQVAFVVHDSENNNDEIFTWDIVNKTSNKLTFDKSEKILPVWTPDGERIVYSSNHENSKRGGLYWRPANGWGEAEKLASEPDRSLFPYSFSSDGKYLLMQERVTADNTDIAMLSMEDDHKRIPLIQTEYMEWFPIISPDDQYIAYTSNESGQFEIYVRPFPDVDKGRLQISQDGGKVALWSPDGKELFYLGLDNSVLVVDVKTKPTFQKGTPRILFQDKYIGILSWQTLWDIHPDGKRFLIGKSALADRIKEMTDIRESINRLPMKINIVLNWDEVLKQRMPVD